MSNDWDLSAIVRSCSSSAAHKAVARNTLEESFVFPDEFFNDLSLSPFPVLIPTRDELDDPFDELSRVYKPFYRRVQRQQQLLTTAVSAPVAADYTIGGSEYKRGRKRVQLGANSVAAVDDGPDSPFNAAGEQEAPLQEQNQNGGAMRSQALRGRRRKQPRLVMKTNGESLSEDSWNWRKYGQKPIFGSMNPRSYYRCSSFKGCAARKQVELCANEPGMFIVTYIGDHTHRRSGGGGFDAGTPGNVSVFPTSDDTPKPSDEAGNENSKQEDDDDIFMAMHALDSTGSAFNGGQPQSPPKSVGTAGGFA